MRRVEVDYLVVGAGAMGMAFTDALIDHADVRVALVDRRDGVGGHWRNAYPFVRLHQASQMYGVASTLLGEGRVQQEGPEAGLHERADQPTICDYYETVLRDRMLAPGRVELFARHEHLGGGRFVSLDSGEELEVPEGCRVVDARYLAPEIPAETPPRFAVADGAPVVPVNALVEHAGSAGRYVVVGSGKTATDACVWLLGQGIDPDAICWVRPREPWMLDRARIQPDPVVFLGMVADLVQQAASAVSLPDLFLRLEEAGVMLRLDPAVEPTMAKTPTLGRWELDLLRSIEDVVRLGHVVSARRGRLELDGGSVALGDDALVVNCAADGLRDMPLVPIWQPDVITLQPIRSGFPCFAAALAGYVEATRDDDAEKNRLCPPSPFGNTLAGWARMTVVGARNGLAFGSAPDIRTWSNGVALNPARIPPGASSPELGVVVDRLKEYSEPGFGRLDLLSRGA